MRNLLQYPITKQELLDFLSIKYKDSISKDHMGCGDMTACYYKELSKLVEQSQYEFALT